jgi:transcriptional regulator with XRE-family HTH domain
MNPIKKLRAEQGMSRSEFSRKSGMSYQTLTALENGLCNTMKNKTAAVVAELAQSTPDTIKKEFETWRLSLKA